MAHAPAKAHAALSKARLARRACSSTSALWTFPSAGSTTPVYEDFELTWDPTCVAVTSATVDLYLSVVESTGLTAVHKWEDVPYSPGSLDTQFKPSWWNASTGAGSVSAQFSLVPSGQPSWNTPAPAGPLFTISYNGTYPSVTSTGDQSTYTGPSVESVSDTKSRSSAPSGGKLAAAVLVPILVVIAAAVAYVFIYKRKKAPEKKRFSAVVDHRMSMISQGTWQPRPSMAASRPGSMHPSHRPSGSYSGANRGSYFANPDHRQSTYSYAGSGVGVPSPLRPPPPAEMRQTGQGERNSRVSFAAGEMMHKPRPSFASGTRSSMHQSQLRHSAFLPGGEGGEPLPASTSPQHSPQLSRSAGPTFGSSGGILARSGSSSLSLAVTAPESGGDYLSHSGTREELASPSPSSGSLASFSRPYGHAPKPSVTSSLRHELNGMPWAHGGVPGSGDRTPPASSAADPFSTAQHPRTSPSSSLRPKPSLASLSTESLALPPPVSTSTMPRAFGSSTARESRILSPDEALASYARDVTSPTPSASQQRGAAKGGLSWPGKLLRSFTGGSIAGVLSSGGGGKDRAASRSGSRGDKDAHDDVDEKRERARSPFEDPVERDDEDDRRRRPVSAHVLDDEHLSVLAAGARDFGSEGSQESLIDEKGGLGRAM
ncbi:hypothetical protein JCM3775_000102 [Rhodotorula graminis]